MYDPISAELSMVVPILLMATLPVLYQISVDDSSIYASVSSVYERQSNQVTPDILSNMWIIGLKTYQRTLKFNTYQCIRTTGILAKHFKTDKAKLQYKQL